MNHSMLCVCVCLYVFVCALYMCVCALCALPSPYPRGAIHFIKQKAWFHYPRYYCSSKGEMSWPTALSTPIPMLLGMSWVLAGKLFPWEGVYKGMCSCPLSPSQWREKFWHEITPTSSCFLLVPYVSNSQQRIPVQVLMEKVLFFSPSWITVTLPVQ